MKETMILLLTVTLLISVSCAEKTPAEEMFRVCWASPQNTMLKNKEALLALYTEDAFVEDPVGTPKLHNKEGLALFFDTFIDNDSTTLFEHHFHISDVENKQLILWADLTVKSPTQTEGTKRSLLVLYNLREDESSFKITSIQGYWTALEGSGDKASIMETVKNMWSVLRHLGISGAYNWVKGVVTGIKSPGKHWAREMVNMMVMRNKSAFFGLFNNDLLKKIEFQGKTFSLTQFWDKYVQWDYEYQFDDSQVESAGYSVAGVFKIIYNGVLHNAAFIVDFSSESVDIEQAVERVRFWADVIKPTVN